jgi:hypothetical protein
MDFLMMQSQKNAGDLPDFERALEQDGDLIDPDLEGVDVAEGEDEYENFNPFLFVPPVGSEESEEDGDEEGKPSRGEASSFETGEWDDPRQQMIFDHIVKRATQLVLQKTPAQKRIDTARWFFVPGIIDQQRMQFELGCRALGARPMVVRARIQYEWWNRGVYLGGPLPDGAVDLPDPLDSEIKLLYRSIDAACIAESLWLWPGATVQDISRASGVDIPGCGRWLGEMQANGHVACTFARWYFISRNPGQMTAAARRKFSFSASIVGEE